MTRTELINILMLDEVKAIMGKLGVTSTPLPANPLHIKEVWLNNDDEDEENDYVNLGYDFEDGCLADYNNVLILSCILDSLNTLEDEKRTSTID